MIGTIFSVTIAGDVVTVAVERGRVAVENADRVAELEAFFTSIRDDSEPPVVGRDGLMSVLIGLAAARSLAEKRPVKVEVS